MRRRGWPFALAFFVLFAPAVYSATLSWVAPSSYTDGSPILPADQARIFYTPYYAYNQDGPWMEYAATLYTSAILPDPAPGGVLWYTVSATLDGQESAKAGAVSKGLPFRVPSTPGGLVVQ